MKTLLILMLTILASNSFSDVYSATGTINDILIRDDLESYAIVYVDGLTDAGACSKNAGKNLVVIAVQSINSNVMGKNEAALSMLLAAYFSRTPIRVSVDDLEMNSIGRCYLRSVRLAP